MPRERDTISAVDTEEKGCAVAGCIAIAIALAIVGAGVASRCSVRVPFTDNGNTSAGEPTRQTSLGRISRLVSNANYINSPVFLMESQKRS